MEKTNENMNRLLEMLDTPSTYTEQEIHDIINNDDETRQAYRLMTAAKQGYRQKQTNQPEDVEAAWQRFEQKHLKTDKAPTIRLYPRFRKVAAAVAAVLLLSGLSYAAIVQIRYRNEAKQAQATMEDTAKQPVAKPIAIPEEKPDTIQAEPKTFDNVPLGDMLPEIANYYGMKVSFQNKEKEALRLFFTWNPAESIDKAITKLNQFESLSVKREGENITVE